MRGVFRCGQSSVEYLFITILALTLILPASFLFFDFSKSSEDAVVSSQVDRTGNEIIAAANQVFVIGEGSRTTLDTALPDSIVSSQILGNYEIVISYYTQHGLTEAVFFSDINLTNGTHSCSPSCDLHLNASRARVRITSRGDHVSIERVW